MKKLRSLTIGFGLVSFMIFGANALNAKSEDVKEVAKAVKSEVVKTADSKTKVPEGVKEEAKKLGDAVKKVEEKGDKDKNATKKEAPKAMKCGAGKCGNK